MSTEITEAFVQQYRTNLIHLSQQKASRLINAVFLKENVTGKSSPLYNFWSRRQIKTYASI